MALFAAAILAVLALSSGGRGEMVAAAQPDGAAKANYIVRMVDDPVVAYEGGVTGLSATAPKAGQKIDPNSADVTAYVRHLNGKHDAALRGVGNAKKLYDYTFSFNGMAVELTAAQAARLAKTPGVLSVDRDELRQMDTSSTPDFLGLTAPGGLWAQLGGVGSAGDGVIIGIIDTGIWPESLSFSDRTGENGNASKDGKLSYQQIPGWHGKCKPGEQFNASNCNQKLIGAQWFNQGFGGDAGVNETMPWEFTSARDYGGHGTHTASTAGGNNGVQATGAAAPFGKISGMAPHARIAAYKALWEVAPGQGSGQTSDLVAAIDQAVADGVDVINYSISGTSTNFADPVEISFLFAARAGIFVSESAGNSGPAAGTVAHPGPWTTTVAAGTHNRNVAGSVTLGNAVTYTGASVATAVGPAPLVDSVNVGLPPATLANTELCVPGTLDPLLVTGKIVLCKRGAIARVDKSKAVLQAGGVGMILYNSPDNSLNADFHFVPTVHVNQASGLAIKAYAATTGATAKINAATIALDAPAPFTALFSSRGPLKAGGGDLLKPDLIAPGQDILAAVAPPGNNGRDFDLYSGTSMSSPHVAGLAALLKDLHPDWSPMAIKSALMTSAYDVLDGSNTSPAVIFKQGAGHVRPNSAAAPGLVYDAGFNDWRNFLKGQGFCNYCFGSSPATAIDASNLNVASIAIGDLAGIQTVTRKVTNVGTATATYSAAVTGMTGITTVVTPSSFTLAPGATQAFTVTFTRTTAALNAYVGGQLTWSDGTHNVRIPMVIQPVALAAPAQVSGTSGTINYNVTFGYSGTFTATGRGLIPAVVTAGNVADDSTDSACSLTSQNAVHVPVTVPLGTTYARFSLFDADVNLGSDIDLCVFQGPTLVGASGSGTSAEEVNLLNPAPGVYTVVVQGWGVVGSSPFKLHTWLLGSASAGNMTVTAPASATLGAIGNIGLTFIGLSSGTKYLGSVAYAGSLNMPNPTIVRVDVP